MLCVLASCCSVFVLRCSLSVVRCWSLFVVVGGCSSVVGLELIDYCVLAGVRLFVV